MRLLIVEDHQETQEVMSLIFTAMGDEVIAVATGADALTVAASGWPDAITLDIALPDMTGWQVLKALRQMPTRVVVYIVSAWEQEGAPSRHDADGCATKPVNVAELRERIANLVEAARH